MSEFTGEVAVPARVPVMRCVGEDVFPPKFELTPAGKQPVAVVRPVPWLG